jgi:hypothetical protein
VLEEEHRVRELTASNACGDLALNLERVAIRDEPELQDVRAVPHR